MSDADSGVQRRPVQPVQVIERNPRPPVRRVIKASELSAFEREQLEKQFGYDGTSDVPSDLAERMEAAGTPINLPTRTEAEVQADLDVALQAAMDAAPEGFQAPTKDLDLSGVKVQQLDEFPAETMENYSRVLGQFQTKDNPFKDAVAGMEGTPAATPNPFNAILKDGVNDIHMKAEAGDLHDDVAQALGDIENDQVDKVDTEDKPAPAAEQPPVREKTSKEKFEELKSLLNDEEDFERYRNCLLTFQMFSKRYELNGGQFVLEFSDSTQDGADMIVEQEAIDQLKLRIKRDLPLQMQNSRRYNFALALRLLQVNGTDVIKLPNNMPTEKYLAGIDRDKYSLEGVDKDDTALRFWARFLQEKVLQSSAKSLILDKFANFQRTMALLHALSSYPEFFTHPARSS